MQRTQNSWLLEIEPLARSSNPSLPAGTAVDILNGLRACGPKRLVIYFTKHSSPSQSGNKDYQRIVPDAWRKLENLPGRF